MNAALWCKGEPPLVLHREIYITASLIGAASFVGAIGVVAGALEKSRHGERPPETPEPDAHA